MTSRSEGEGSKAFCDNRAYGLGHDGVGQESFKFAWRHLWTFFNKFGLKPVTNLDELVKGLEDADRLELGHGKDLDTAIIGTQKHVPEKTCYLV